MSGEGRWGKAREGEEYEEKGKMKGEEGEGNERRGKEGDR